MDKISEEIAHFIGAFALASEEARSRHDYQAFYVRPEKGIKDAPLEAAPVVIKAPFDFQDFDPSVEHEAPAPEMERVHSGPVPSVAVPSHFVPLTFYFASTTPQAGLDEGAGASRASAAAHAFKIAPPGSVVAIVEQHSTMSDMDTISLGDHGLFLDVAMLGGRDLAPLLDAAFGLDPLFADLLPGADVPGSVGAIGEFVADARALLLHPEATALFDGGEASVFRASGDHLAGTYVNGVLGAELPDFKLLRPDENTASGAEEAKGNGLFHASGAHADGQGGFLRQSTIDLEAGDNRLVNVVELTNNWIAGRVTAVMGDHVELNAIVQINAYSDHDFLTSSIGHAADDAATAAFNIATFLRIDPAANHDHGAAAASAKPFPSFWAVTEIKGDLLVMNWLEQINFMSDGDVATLAAAGTRLGIVTGGNTATNFVSLSELGSFYDLIVVGGSVYDINIVRQMNVLLDDDLVGAVGGFGASGASTVASHGNLLWNEARIVDVGAPDRFGALSEPFRQAADTLAGGGGRPPADLLHDAGFAGTGVLRTLYISGDMIDLQFVRQTNILGDADTVALAMSRTHADAGADWTISTGHNTLLNVASIVDVDALGKTLVGGGAYSDEILIQADLVSAAPDLKLPGADALVSEAVVFLTDDMLSSSATAAHGLDAVHAGSGGGLPLNSLQADPMHTLAA